MSANPLPLQVREANYGALVTGGAKTLPALNTPQTIFNVVGGRVVITSLTAVVTTVVQSQACTLSVGNTPTGGSAAPTSLCTATSISGITVGTSLALPVAQTSALIVSSASGVILGNTISVPIQSGGIALVPAGAIIVQTSATNTGAIVYSVTYFAYDSGATITAA
jgi:hypothetical protein